MKHFVTSISSAEGLLLQEHLQHAGFHFTKTLHAHFTAIKPDIRCTLYTSGKLLLQGKGIGEFIEFGLEPAVGRLFERSNTQQVDPRTSAQQLLKNEVEQPKIGQDEAGKGDLFGPLCVAGVYISDREKAHLKGFAIRDGKQIKDRPLRQLAQQIKEICPHVVLVLTPSRYNERYDKHLNLNTLLAHCHAEVFAELSTRTNCQRAIVDQFAFQGVLLKAFRQMNLSTQALMQRVRAEDDLAVACASILARDAFLNWLEIATRTTGFTLPKGAGAQVLEMAKKIFLEKGCDNLKQLTKWHFKTIGQVVGKFEDRSKATV